jgi:hypothetical protein
MIFWFLDFFTEHLFTSHEHPCSAERSLGNTGTYNAVPVPKDLANKT